jgi:hypothetical protein
MSGRRSSIAETILRFALWWIFHKEAGCPGAAQGKSPHPSVLADGHEAVPSIYRTLTESSLSDAFSKVAIPPAPVR